MIILFCCAQPLCVCVCVSARPIMAITIAVMRQQYAVQQIKPKVYKLQFVEFKVGLLFFAYYIFFSALFFSLFAIVFVATQPFLLV